MKEPIEFKKNDLAGDFPKIVNVCVLRGKCWCQCFHCPVGIVDIKDRSSQFNYMEMELLLFQKIVDEMVLEKSQPVLRIHSVGEPLMWEHIGKAMQYARKKGVKTWLFTSLALKDDALLKLLCGNADIIEVSVNSIEAVDYKKTKGIGAFELVQANIKMMGSHIQSKKLKTRLIASRVQSSDEQLDKKFIFFWKASGLVDDAFVRSYHSYNNLMEDIELTENKKAPCLVHWARFNINTDGDAVVCFNELFKEKLEPEIILGNLNKESISGLWQGRHLNMIRDAELSGEYDRSAITAKLPCIDCTFCQPLEGVRETSEKQLKQI